MEEWKDIDGYDGVYQVSSKKLNQDTSDNKPTEFECVLYDCIRSAQGSVNTPDVIAASWKEELLRVALKQFTKEPKQELSHSEVTKNSDQLTEFEEELYNCIGDYTENGYYIDNPKEFVELNAEKLLSIARKQIASEINISGMAMCVNWLSNHYYSNIEMNQAYRQGIEDTIKALEKGE